MAVLAQEHQREFFTDYSEALTWLGLLLMYHPSRGAQEYNALHDNIMEFSSTELPVLKMAYNLGPVVIELAAEDPRVQVKRGKRRK
jgi:hypothetical protein